MLMTRSVDKVAHEVTVPVAADDAFYVFAHEFSYWWPKAYTWSGQVLDTIGMEPYEGGRCFERGPHGFTCDWGRVLVWQPDEEIAFLWQISPERQPVPDPSQASRVRVRFRGADADRTVVALRHTDFAHHGEGHEAYRDAMASEQGWPYILSAYARHVVS